MERKNRMKESGGAKSKNSLQIYQYIEVIVYNNAENVFSLSVIILQISIYTVKRKNVHTMFKYISSVFFKYSWEENKYFSSSIVKRKSL